MNLERALDGFLERVRSDDVEMGSHQAVDRSDARTNLARREALARASERLGADLAAAQATANRWRILTLLVVCALAAGSAFSHGIWQAAGVVSAGGLTAALLSIWRKQFAGDLLVALLKATDDPEQRATLVRTLRDRL